MKLWDLMSQDDLELMLSEGMVRIQIHPEFSYMILKYSHKAHNTRTWNSVTRNCRGMIVDRKWNILARPFMKFFNLGETPKEYRTWNALEPVCVTDKMDGSLGISYTGPDDLPYIATAGSFTSEQAIRATKMLREKYPDWRPYPGVTYLFEIVYPENRIVVDYGKTEDLVLLGAVGMYSGQNYTPNQVVNWNGPRTRVMEYASLKEAIQASPRENAEGLVVHFLECDERLKLKQDDYVELHRIVSDLDEQVVWAWLKEGKDPQGLKDSLPEEFESWIDKTVNGLLIHHDSLMSAARMYKQWYSEDFYGVRNSREDRKRYAARVKEGIDPQFHSLMFALLDGIPNKAEQVLWNALKPAKIKPGRGKKESTDVGE